MSEPYKQTHLKQFRIFEMLHSSHITDSFFQIENFYEGHHKYIALFNNNSFNYGFHNLALQGNALITDFGSKPGFFFCSYDYKNQIENLTSKNNSPLKFN